MVIVDSGSTDNTRTIAASFPNVAWFERPFDGYAGQWSQAIHATAIDTPYVLALDADMPVPATLRDELSALAFRDDLAGVVIGFEYCIEGHPLLGSVYPAQLRLLRVGRVAIGEEGHKHVFRAQGSVVEAGSRLIHDDRKPLERFMASQLKYFGNRGRAADGAWWRHRRQEPAACSHARVANFGRLDGLLEGRRTPLRCGLPPICLGTPSLRSRTSLAFGQQHVPVRAWHAGLRSTYAPSRHARPRSECLSRRLSRGPSG